MVQSLLADSGRDQYLAQVRADYERIREQHRDKKGPGPLLPLAEARRRGFQGDWKGYVPPAPAKPGLTVLRDYPLAELVPYIDWSPFFQAWELSGAYPKILQDPVVGDAARKLFAEAQEMLERIVRERWIVAHGVAGLFPAARVGEDDIAIYGGADRQAPHMTWHNLRQQNQKPAGNPNLCLADFVAPAASGVADWIGAFAVNAGGIESRVADFERRHDDYSAIMLKVLADRLAEAFAERLHQRVRREFWAYAPDERLDAAALIAESYRGIRAALFRLLDAERHAGMRLPESYAMLPASAVSGFYLSHPQSRYFAIGRIGRDQLEDFARRGAMPLEQAEKWLAPNL